MRSRFVNVYTGVARQLTAQGTKYYKDEGLN